MRSLKRSNKGEGRVVTARRNPYDLVNKQNQSIQRDIAQ